MKKQPHFIKKIITAVFCLLLIVTAFIPGIELYRETKFNSDYSSNTSSAGVATMITPSQLINAGNASDEEIAKAKLAAEKKAEEIVAKYAAMDGLTFDNEMNDEIKNAKETNEYYALIIRNGENIIPNEATSSSVDKDFVKLSNTYSLITVIFYVLVALLFALMILQMFLNIKALAIITRILSVCVLLVSVVSLISIFSMNIYAEFATGFSTTSTTLRCNPTLAGPVAIILSIPTMILALCSFCKKKNKSNEA